MEPSVLKIKQEFDDIPEDHAHFVGIKELSLARDISNNDSPNNSFHHGDVKTEFKEETETDKNVSACSELNNLQEEEVTTKKKRCKQKNKHEFKCEHCGVVCPDKNRYKWHIMDHTGERPFQCNLCDKGYKKAQDLTYHMILHTGKHDHHCEICGKGFVVRSALKAHSRTHTKDKPYICPLCGRGFSHSSSLKPHIAVHSKDTFFECHHCDKKFKTKKTLQRHMRVHEDKEPESFQCGVCLKFYKSKESIKVHLKMHSLEKSEHTENAHSCDHCGKTYKHIFSLRNHMRYHTNNMFECHMCDKAYVDKKHLRIHLRNHTGETPFTCEICNKSFRRKDSYIYHKTTHESNRKTYKCHLCDKELVCKSSLRAHHIQIHSTERKHQCQTCGKSYKLRYELTKHCRKHKNEEGSGDDGKSKQVPAGVSDKKACEICLVECSADELEAHMSSHDLKPFKCECFKVFFVESKYKRHVAEECDVVRKSLEVPTGKVDGPVKKEGLGCEVMVKECHEEA